MLQWKPLNDNALVRNPHYAPDRDLAYIGPSLLGMAMMAIDDQLESPQFKEWCQHYNVTLDDIKHGAKLLGNAAYQMNKSCMQVLEEAGFFELKPPVQAFFFTKLGQAAFAAIHCGVRDVLPKDAAAPMSIKEFSENIYKVFSQFSEDILLEEKRD